MLLLFAKPISWSRASLLVCQYLLVQNRFAVPLDQAHMGNVKSLDSTSVKPAFLIQLAICKGARGSLYGCWLLRYFLDHRDNAWSIGKNNISEQFVDIF